MGLNPIFQDIIAAGQPANLFPLIRMAFQYSNFSTCKL
jgi:hypothetical protein